VINRQFEPQRLGGRIAGILNRLECLEQERP
jgi:hypothetical protein